MSQKPVIYFSHANSFPAGCYQQLFNRLRPDYEIHFVDKFGHNPAYPVTDNWDYLVDELIDAIATHHNAAPVYAVGHSLGGVLSFLAAVKRPELFRGVVLLDAPVYGRLKSMLIKAIKHLGWMDRVTPGGRTKGRKRQWRDAEEAFCYLKARKVFANFIDACLKDYIEHGMEVAPAGLRLKFNVDIEYQIYQTIPHHLPRFRKKLCVPLALLYGHSSEVIRPRDVRLMKKHLDDIIIREVKGGHLFPFEHPYHTADNILAVLREFHLSAEKNKADNAGNEK